MKKRFSLRNIAGITAAGAMMTDVATVGVMVEEASGATAVILNVSVSGPGDSAAITVGFVPV